MLWRIGKCISICMFGMMKWHEEWSFVVLCRLLRALMTADQGWWLRVSITGTGRSQPLLLSLDTVDVALTSAEEILGQILSTATTRGTLQELKAWGFTFDIVIKRGGRVQLVEVNPFGVDSRCGSCLFHWIDDAKLLYGGKNGIEVSLLI